VPDHPQPGYKRDARMDKSIIINMIIRAPSRVSPQTFVNFVYLYVNKPFTTQTLLKVAPNVGHNVKIVNYQSENVATDPNISPNNFSAEKFFF
jgi:hypothetical protein